MTKQETTKNQVFRVAGKKDVYVLFSDNPNSDRQIVTFWRFPSEQNLKLWVKEIGATYRKDIKYVLKKGEL